MLHNRNRLKIQRKKYFVSEQLMNRIKEKMRRWDYAGEKNSGAG